MQNITAKEIVQTIHDELDRLDKCDELLTKLRHHHISQSRTNPRVPQCTPEYHAQLACDIDAVSKIRL